MTDCFVVVHLSSIDAYAFEGGDAADLLDQIVMTAQEAPCVIVIDQGWDGRYARRLRAELSGLKPLVFAHDEEIDGWRGFRKAFPKFLRGLGVRSVVLGGLWREGCVSEVRKILTAAGFLVSVDDDASGSEAVFCPEDAD
jgi:nicotinamidase-related amidase